MSEEQQGTLDREAIFARGESSFMGHDFYVEPHTLIPREVSAILVNATIELVERGVFQRETFHFVDQCGGSGNIGCALALRIPHARGWSTDLMPASSALARRNADRHGIAHRLEVRTGDLFGAIQGLELEERIDVVTCSPPFISSGRLEHERAWLLEREPREAFDAGPYGTSILARLVKESVAYLRPGGYLICEYGAGQDKQAEMLAKRTKAYDSIEVLRDAEGVARAIRARKSVAGP